MMSDDDQNQNAFSNSNNNKDDFNGAYFKLIEQYDQKKKEGNVDAQLLVTEEEVKIAMRKKELQKKGK